MEKEHVDYEYINKIRNGHGATYSYIKPDGIVIVDWIYGKNIIQLFWYNAILFIRYLIRKVKRLNKK